MKTKIASIISLFLLAFVVVVPSALAVKPDDPGSRGKMMRDRKVTPGQGRMTACQAREAAVEKRMMGLTRLATTMQSKFDRHSQQVQNYYSTKVVPSGKIVANYAELLAAIQTQKTAVATALAAAQSDVNAFSCASDSPKTLMTEFRENMQAVKQALKAYRTAIKDLIVAVHSVAGDEDELSPTVTP